jgi:PrcB C-terminal
MFPRSVLSAGFAALLILAFQLGMPCAARAQIPFDVILHSNNPLRSPDARTVVVLRSQAELVSFWRSLGRTIAPPEIDFRRHTLLVYFVGTRATGGYRLDVEQLEIRSGTMTLHIVESEPGPCCGTTQAVTSPAIWITTIPFRGEVEAVLRKETRSCCSN